MKKNLILWAACSTLVLSGCDTYAGSGAYAGSGIGAILGSAIGGLTGGPRGSDAGTIIGMAGGAVIGGAIGSQADERRQADYDQYRRDRAVRMQERTRRQNTSSYDNSQRLDTAQAYDENGNADSGFDSSNSGDDRIYDFNSSDYNGNYSARQPVTTLPSRSSAGNVLGSYAYAPYLEIRNARFVDDNQDNVLGRNEVCKIIFEIYNTSNQTVTDIVPTVIEASRNRHIYISPSIHVERIAPGRGIRYTAVVKADGKLRDGYARFCVSVIQGNRVLSKVSEFNIPTRGVAVR